MQKENNIISTGEHNMKVEFDEQCLDVLRRLELDRALVESTCNNRTRGMIVPGNPM